MWWYTSEIFFCGNLAPFAVIYLTEDDENEQTSIAVSMGYIIM